MGDPGMALREEDVRRIVDYVKPWLRDLVSETAAPRSHDISAQIVRVEEELKGQRELFAERFKAIDQRFVAMDQRFSDMQKHMDQRFSDTQKHMDQRFSDMQQRMDQRFTDMQKQMDTRFESMDKRFGTMQWTMLFGFTIVTVAVTVFGLLA